MVRLGKAVKPDSVKIVYGADKYAVPRFELYIEINGKVIPKYMGSFDAVKRELEWLFLGEWNDS